MRRSNHGPRAKSALQLTDLNNLGSYAGNIKTTILYKIHITKNNIRTDIGFHEVLLKSDAIEFHP